MFQRIPVGEEPSGRAFTLRIGPILTFMLALGDKTAQVEKSTDLAACKLTGDAFVLSVTS